MSKHCKSFEIRLKNKGHISESQSLHHSSKMEVSFDWYVHQEITSTEYIDFSFLTKSSINKVDICGRSSAAHISRLALSTGPFIKTSAELIFINVLSLRKLSHPLHTPTSRSEISTTENLFLSMHLHPHRGKQSSSATNNFSIPLELKHNF